MPSLIDLGYHGYIKAMINGAKTKSTMTITISITDLETYWNSVERQVQLDTHQAINSGLHAAPPSATQPQSPVNPVGAQGNAGNPGYNLAGNNPAPAPNPAPTVGQVHPAFNPQWGGSQPAPQQAPVKPQSVIRDADGTVISREAVARVMGWK